MILRPATAGDRRAIRSIVWAARINPLELDWRRFLVAEEAGRVVGVGQVKPLKDGSRELASIAVIPEVQGQGIGRAIVEALIAREGGPLVLTCQAGLEPYYRRFGFERLPAGAASPALAARIRLGNRMVGLGRLLGQELGEIIAMARP
jgi:amino-acid N-acetyltransferase